MVAELESSTKFFCLCKTCSEGCCAIYRRSCPKCKGIPACDNYNPLPGHLVWALVMIPEVNQSAKAEQAI